MERIVSGRVDVVPNNELFNFSDREQAQGMEDRRGPGDVGLRQVDAQDHRRRARL